MVLGPCASPNVLQAFAGLAGQTGAVWLDSAKGGRLSLLAADPIAVQTWSHRCPEGTGKDPFDGLRRLARLAARGLDIPPRLGIAGPVIGMLGYELGGRLERLPAPHLAGVDMPDFWAALYDTLAVYDHSAAQLWIVSNGLPETDPKAQQTRAAWRAEDFYQKLCEHAGRDADCPAPVPALPWRAERTRADHEAAVAAAIAHIHAGDIYQANITQRFIAERPANYDLFALYRRLRTLSPAPMGGFLNLGDGRALLSASPERFLRADAAGSVETSPIKGTRPRGATAAADQAEAEALCRSDKDRAENLMIVDLLRNDLARVCAPGSIAVPELCALHSFQSVHHLVSTVTGRLRAECDTIDLLMASFPGGSITGAPKIRAMEIIRDLEPARRGPYCGSLFALGGDGALDSNILIRTIVADDKQLVAQAGGGIIADSDPSAEYEESLTKVAALLRAGDDGCDPMALRA